MFSLLLKFESKVDFSVSSGFHTFYSLLLPFFKPKGLEDIDKFSLTISSSFSAFSSLPPNLFTDFLCKLIPPSVLSGEAFFTFLGEDGVYFSPSIFL